MHAWISSTVPHSRACASIYVQEERLQLFLLVGRSRALQIFISTRWSSRIAALAHARLFAACRWCGRYSSCWQTDLVHSKYSYLLAYEPLLTRSTYGLNCSSDVDCTELVVRSTGLMFIQGWFANTDDRIDGWFTNTTQVSSLTILLTITKRTCCSLG